MGDACGGASDTEHQLDDSEQFPVAGPTVKVQVKSLSMVFAGIPRSMTPMAPPLILAV